MKEQFFFEYYSGKINENKDDYLHLWLMKREELIKKMQDIPFSNVWVAQKISSLIPENSVVHFGILNSLSSWNYFELPKSVRSNSNVGGFGIDGCVSSLIGASLANRNKLYFGVFGDLSFFYDLNSVGNRHIGSN
jgi:2-succinyl-5-enolpyruvyl-6-hydroxy-3-cyclohexene-1-carboxylate synthase